MNGNWEAGFKPVLGSRELLEALDESANLLVAERFERRGEFGATSSPSGSVRGLHLGVAVGIVRSLRNRVVLVESR